MGKYISFVGKVKDFGLKKTCMLAYDVFMKKIDVAFNRTNLLFRPTWIQLEPTTKCNLRCKFCVSPVWDRRGMDMSFEDFKKIIDQFPYLVDILLQGVGEPLLCKDYIKMIKYCKSRNIRVTSTTNATLLDREMSRKIIDSGIDIFVVSIDGASKETFEGIRIGADYDKVLKNIKGFVEIRGNRKKPEIHISFTGNMENISELPDILKLAKELGVDGVDMQGIHFWNDENLKEKRNDDTLVHNIGEVKRIVNESIPLAKELCIELNVLGTGNRKGPYSDCDLRLHADPKLCQKKFKSLFVTVDGFVTICAAHPDPRQMNYGNLLKEDFDTIWNSPQYVELRKRHLKGDIPKQCRTCSGPTIIR